ncbi:ABC transporter ATP-binding protein [Paenibacillus naphthalenovorans]|uniref:ABC transporter ATP-binding protein n=1 Tax=Paenibacillus naphthalenovorans TaxID=162209 RepID=UPI00087FC3B0|nr:ABC transporter ATP-binding protein [Paenibacillus naphthalenovorans]SDJ31968.1 peptide/nickel transport system ATP-binding protein [Paenibacillus naphthalenovorans]
MEKEPMMSPYEPVLQVHDLHTHFFTESGTVKAVNGVSFDLQRGERLAIVGESGSGKSAMAMSLIQLIAHPGKVVSGSVKLEGQELIGMSDGGLNKLRGSSIGTVFQDPMASLDPVMRIEDQMVIPIRKHLKLGAKEARAHAIQLLSSVGIPDAEKRITSYPFEMSGGMRQRVMIAMAISCNPKLIIADEPTTALDVTIQAQIVELMKSITEKTGSAMVFITHDLGLVARFAQKVAVMYAGKIVEYGTVHEIFGQPKHPYTQSLLMTIPSVSGEKRERLLQIQGFPPDMKYPVLGCAYKERCPVASDRCYHNTPELTVRGGQQLTACWELRGLMGDGEDKVMDLLSYQRRKEAADIAESAMNLEEGNHGRSDVVLEIRELRKHYKKTSVLPWKKSVEIRAVNGIDLTLKQGETIGIVGESGCGKSTTARMLLQLEQPTSGSINASGNIQIVFQDPYSSFNPKMSIEDIIAEPLNVQKIGTREDRKRKVRDLIQKVGLDPAYLDRYPSQLSGGQRQRVGVARALALNPSVVVADEPTSALDVSVRAQIINLLCDLKEEMGLSFIFISHDLSTVRYISDTIAVMYLGEIVEFGPAEEVFTNPAHPYTKALLAAVPVPDPFVEEGRSIKLLSGEMPSPANPPAGCAFSTRCPMATEQCMEEKPALTEKMALRKVACHAVS